jgi:hypothetical protein
MKYGAALYSACDAMKKRSWEFLRLKDIAEVSFSHALS